MRIGVVSDIQGNVLALQAVLGALQQWPERVDSVVCAGDMVGLGPFPNEVIDTLRQSNIDCVLGNYDDAVAHERLGSGVDFAHPEDERADAAAVAWTRQRLTAENLEFLRLLPRNLKLSRAGVGIEARRNDADQRAAEYRRTFFARALFGGLAKPTRSFAKRIVLVHASPRALNEFVYPGAALSLLAAVTKNAEADVLIFGHAAIGFHRQAHGTHFIGVGPVNGSPSTPDFAEFAVVTIDEEVNAEFGRAQFDLSAHLRDLRASGLPASLLFRYRE